MLLSELDISDGQITEFTVQSDTVTILLKDWQEKTYKIIFKDVIGVEAYSPENIDLCHIDVKSSSKALQKVCLLVREDENEITKYSKYSFFSAWSEFPILIIFGMDVEIIRLTQ